MQFFVWSTPPKASRAAAAPPTDVRAPVLVFEQRKVCGDLPVEPIVARLDRNRVTSRNRNV